MAWEKKEVYVITIFLKDMDEEGEPMNWSEPSEEYYANTLEEAEEMKNYFLQGKNEFYGTLIEDCTISEGKEEREFFI